MKFCVFLLGVSITGAASMNHTLRFFTTISSQIPGFPQFVEVGFLNDLEIIHYDNDTKRLEPRQDWMKTLKEKNPQFWETYTEGYLNFEQVANANIKIANQLLKEIGGSHVVQFMLGCDWDEESGEVRGHLQTALDGEDFITLDMETLTWVALTQKPFGIKLLWDGFESTADWKHEVENVCVYFLKKCVRYGEKTLKRKELPLVAFLQKSSSSPVTCFASGFYPKEAKLFWTKDGEELQEDWGEILPNHDGTFQTSVSLDLSSVPTGDWGRYSCVFQLSGVKDDLITKLDPGLIRTNEKKNSPYVVAGACALGAVVCAVIGYFLYRRYKDKQLRPQSSEPEEQELNSPPPQTQ